MAKEANVDLNPLDSGKGQIDTSLNKNEEKLPSDPGSGGSKIKGKKKLLIYGMAGLIFLGGSAVAAFQLGWIPISGQAKNKKSESHIAEQTDMGPIVKLSPIVINLKDEGGRHYLKVTLVLEMGKNDKPEEIQSRMSGLMDTVILTLSDKRMENLKPPESKESLKQELLQKINLQLDPKKVKGIYFDEFLYQ